MAEIDLLTRFESSSIIPEPRIRTPCSRFSINEVVKVHDLVEEEKQIAIKTDQARHTTNADFILEGDKQQGYVQKADSENWYHAVDAHTYWYSAILMILFTVTCFSIVGCNPLIHEETCLEIVSPNLASIIQSKSGIELPTSYYDLHAYEESGLDWMMKFSFKMKHSQLEKFIIKSQFQGKLERNPIRRQVHDSAIHSWFRPNQAREYLAGQYFSKNEKLAKAKKMFIDLDDPEIVTVYIQVFSM